MPASAGGRELLGSYFCVMLCSWDQMMSWQCLLHWSNDKNDENDENDPPRERSTTCINLAVDLASRGLSTMGELLRF